MLLLLLSFTRFLRSFQFANTLFEGVHFVDLVLELIDFSRLGGLSCALVFALFLFYLIGQEKQNDDGDYAANHACKKCRQQFP